MNRLYDFFIGRNGFDKLNLFFAVIYAIIAIINAFLHNVVLYIILWVLFLLIIFRTVSKNIPSRQKENLFYLNCRDTVINKLNLPYMRIRDIKKNRYRRCRHCKAIVRLPINKGKHNVKCPACHGSFDVFILF